MPTKKPATNKTRAVQGKKAVPAIKKHSSKGALIKGASTKLPLELLYEPSFKEGLQSIMRDYSGIYLLYRRKSLYYIGLAKNLYWRLLAHTKNKHKGKWDNFVIYRIGRVRYLKDIETLLLRVADPPGNSVSGHFRRDADISKVLRKVQREQMRRLKHISDVLDAG